MEWTVIPKYSLYEASIDGRIRNRKTGLTKTVDVRQDGYGYVSLKPDVAGMSRVLRVHKILAQTFLGECPIGYSVDHIDRNPRNNAISNLRYASHKEQRKNSSNKGVSFQRNVELLDASGTIIGQYDSAKLCYEALGLTMGMRAFYRKIGGSLSNGYIVRYKEVIDLEGEIWKPIIGFESTHLVSNLGRVKTVDGRLILQSLRHDYYRVSLNKGGKTSKCSVHRLVAEAFHGSPSDSDLIVNHIDGNKKNNRAENLNWLTRSENSLHAIGLGLRKKRKTSE